MKNHLVGRITVVILAMTAVACGPDTGKGGAAVSPTDSQRAHYREACQPIVAWIEEQKRLTGGYPSALLESQLSTIRKLDPLSGYRSFDRGAHFELSIGEYVEHHQWVYYYSSRTGEWFLDG